VVGKRIRAFMTRPIPIDMDDLLYFGGLGLVSYGAWTIYDPAGFIVAGVGLLFLGTAGAARPRG
jgi:hypothetical protein